MRLDWAASMVYAFDIGAGRTVDLQADVTVFSTGDPDLFEVCLDTTHYIGCVRWEPAGWIPIGAFAFTLGKRHAGNSHHQSQHEAVERLVVAWADRLLEAIAAKRRPHNQSTH